MHQWATSLLDERESPGKGRMLSTGAEWGCPASCHGSSVRFHSSMIDTATQVSHYTLRESAGENILFPHSALDRLQLFLRHALSGCEVAYNNQLP